MTLQQAWAWIAALVPQARLVGDGALPIARVHTDTRTLQPGDTLLLTKIQTAIGSASGVKNYTLDLTADVPADIDELNVIGVITWPTL